MPKVRSERSSSKVAKQAEIIEKCKTLLASRAASKRYRLKGIKPFYAMGFGAAYLGDSRQVMQKIPDESVNLIVTSPPFALTSKKEYGNEVES